MARRISRFAVFAASHLGTIAAVVLGATPQVGALDLPVSAEVTNSCSVIFADGAPAGLDFGNLAPGDAAAASTSLRVSCTFSSNPTVTINNGSNFNSGRRLKLDGGTVFVPYVLCQTAPSGGSCSPWPDTGVPVSTSSAGASLGVHAFISATNSELFTLAGTYTDALVVEVNL